MMMTTTETPSYKPGLEGVIAGSTRICSVSPAGDTLTYRGYDIKDLLAHCQYEEVAYLLLFGELPTASQYAEFRGQLVAERAVPEPVLEVIRRYPKDAHPMDALKASVALLALYDPDKNTTGHEANVRKAIRVTAKLPTLVAAAARANEDKPVLSPAGPELSHSENFLYMLQGQKPNPVVARVFDASLIIYAEHGFNASTFSARVATSTLSDLFSGVTAAIGALKGPLHGGANEAAMRVLMEIGSEERVLPWLEEALAEKRKIMGFGHREYKTGDPRARVLTAMRDELLAALPPAAWPAIADKLEAEMVARKGLHPNVDFPIGYMYYMMGIPIAVYTPIFAIGRVIGWSSHIVEQLDNNKLIRPAADYQGNMGCRFIPMDER